MNGERGSLPLALLATLSVATLATAIMLAVVTGQRQARFDQSFEQALPAAETGLNRVSYLLESGSVAPPPVTTAEVVRIEDVTEQGERFVTTAGWDATARRWTVRSTGTALDGTSRTVVAEVSFPSLFRQAAFGKLFANFNGGNGADSYRSGSLTPSSFTPKPGGSDICKAGAGGVPTSQRADPFSPADADVAMCAPTGAGVVATNGELFLKGQTIAVTDAAEIHFSSHADRLAPLEPLPNARGRCLGVTATCTSPKLRHFRQPMAVDFDPVVLPADPQGRFPQDDPTPTPLGDAGPRHPVRNNPSACTPRTGTTSCLGPGVHVFSDATLSEVTDIQGSPTDPTIVYLSGGLNVPNGAVVNFERNAANQWVPRPAPSLLIFSAGTGPALDFGNHASIAAAIHAPNTGFVGGAQGNVYGALVAGSINNNGGWNFHYDEALGQVAVNAQPRRTRWAENP